MSQGASCYSSSTRVKGLYRIAALPILLLLAFQTTPPDSAQPAPATFISAPEFTPQTQTSPGSSASYVRHVGGSVTAPKFISGPEPLCSKEARNERIEGITTVSLIVDAQGNPVNVHVLRSMANKVDEKHRVVPSHSVKPRLKRYRNTASFLQWRTARPSQSR
jgi:hypothetical protein